MGSRSTPFDDFLRVLSDSCLILVVVAPLEGRLPLRLDGCFGAGAAAGAGTGTGAGAGAGGGVGCLGGGGPLSERRFIIDMGLLARAGGGGGGGAATDSWPWACE